MNKRIIAIMLTVIVITLTGCQLAVDTVNEDALYNPDRLAGVVVTTEHLDLFDMEGYLGDNLNAIMAGKNPDQSAYQGRLYAQEEVEYGTTDAGNPCYTTYYNFDHVDGIALLWYTTYTYLEDGSVLAEIGTGLNDDGLWDVHFSTELTEGTVYFPENGEMMVFLNPVYQDSEGKLYLVAGQGMHGDAYLGEMSMNYTEKLTETENGEEVTRNREFKITAKGVPISDRVVFVQMDSNNQIILRQEFAPEDLPEELIPEENCAYMILEQHAGDKVTREMLQKDRDWISVHTMGDKPYCLGESMTIVWKE